MNEKALQILEQYDIGLQRSFGGRGGIMLETEQGLKMLKEFAGSRARLPFEQKLLEILEQQGVCRTDRAVPNREGELVTVGEYEVPYLIKNWPPGKECDPKNEEELLRSMRTLARLHRTARSLWHTEGEERRWLQGKERCGELERHNREMKRARNYIRGRQKKGEFELLYLHCAEELFRDGQKALELLVQAGGQELYARACREEHICHGEYVHHNILMNRQETAVVNFGHFEINAQVQDISLFLRKIMEKQSWNGKLAARMLTAYEKELPLSGEERLCLAANLYYPEKAWKLAHHYYHTNKAWVPEKSAEKLKVFLTQGEMRKRMLRELFELPV